MSEHYHLMLSNVNKTEECRDFLRHCMKEALSDQPVRVLQLIKGIKSRARLDLGVRMDCVKCRKMTGYAMIIAANCPSIQVHIINLDRVVNQDSGSGRSCLPFILINGQYPFFGYRSLNKMILMLAEAAGRQHEN
ncbi:MAG: hypothetical protein IJ137_12925 [Eubacterium sp.]|nr:hypothetical protein [Eubacterium sp.]